GSMVDSLLVCPVGAEFRSGRTGRRAFRRSGRARRSFTGSIPKKVERRAWSGRRRRRFGRVRPLRRRRGAAGPTESFAGAVPIPREGDQTPLYRNQSIKVGSTESSMRIYIL